jgi:hypothetical protein
MIEKTANRFDWWLPLYGAIGALIVPLPMIIFGANIGPLLLTLVVAAIISLILLVVVIRTIRHQYLPLLVMLLVFCTVSWFLFRLSDELRTELRWLLLAQSYKAAVHAQPQSADGRLKHVEWDGWGFPGAGNPVVYLVFDPNDSLDKAAKRHSPGKFSGIPCEVPTVQRLESHWYTVLFYTDMDWNHCS